MSGLNTDRPIGEIDGAKMCAVISDETRTVDRCSRWTVIPYQLRCGLKTGRTPDTVTGKSDCRQIPRQMREMEQECGD